MSDTTLIVLAVAAAGVGVLIVLFILRRRYVNDLRSRGWEFESSPSLESFLRHQAPPFGLGFERNVDERISGRTASGVGFDVVEYTCRGGGPTFDERVASLQLPMALPPLFVSHEQVRTGVFLPAVEVGPGWQVRSDHPEYATAVLSGPVCEAIGSFGATVGKVDLSIDGDRLVAVGAPKNPDELHSYLEALAPVVTALDADTLARFIVTAPDPRFGFFGHPDWQLLERDDSLIDLYNLTREGSHHRTELVLRSANDGLPLDAFVHRWQTTRRETHTDSRGRRRTRTVTEHHDETVTGVRLPGELPQLSLNGGWGGRRVKFELEEFNSSFAVRTDNAKFASDVIHPRMMEWLMSVDPPAFEIVGRVMRFSPKRHDSLLIGRTADFAHEFLARVPSFVWRDLRVSPPRFRSALMH